MGKCVFNAAWTEHKVYSKWIAPRDGDKTYAKCTLCDKSFDVSNMGEAALKSHMKSQKHQTKVKLEEAKTGTTATQMNMNDFYKKNPVASTSDRQVNL